MRHFVCLALLASACSSDKPKTCDPAAQTGCKGTDVCETVSGGDPACFAPFDIEGRVIDLASGQPVAGARVVALDVNGAAASSVAISATDGTYKLPVPVERNMDGSLTALTVSLRADAAGYQSFPGTLRQALPLDNASAVADGAGYKLQSSLTDIGLIAEPGAAAGSLSGKVAIADDHAGVLVVAELNGKGYSSIADRDGAYTIFNLPAGPYAVTGYAVDHVYAGAEVDVAATEAKLDLALGTDMPGSITGQVDIVDGGGGTQTSAVAFVESTFDPKTGRGVMPPGLRAPRTGVPNVSGAFTIDGVPPGKYVVVAAFENDLLVRDPDHCIAGTSDVHVQVSAGAATAAPSAFKVTGALAEMSPGATAADGLTAAPTFLWADDAGEDQYLVEVFDAFGQQVWSQTIPGVSGSQPSLAYGGPALQPGMYYQWRVTSSKQQGGSGVRCELSRSEDLRGVFFMQ